MQRKLDEGQFDFEDFLDQLRQVKKLGPLTDILSMLPGANRMMKDVDPNMAEDSLKRTEAIINNRRRRSGAVPVFSTAAGAGALPWAAAPRHCRM
ncbi:MAG: hypothetical protein R3A10_17775 [Caldilineaceae bacterium]